MLFNEQDGREAAPRGWSGTVIGWLAAITLVVGGANALAATDGATMIQAEPERALISIGSEQFKPLLPLGINRLHVDLDSPTAAQKATIQNQPEQIGVPRQIGFSRDIQTLGTPSDAAAALTWQSLPSGGQAASFSIASPDAQGIRVGLRIYALPDNAIVRFYASGAGSAFEVSGKTIVGLIAQNLAAGDGSEDANTYWSPVIDGIEAVVEIELPPGTPSSQVRLAVPKISHLVVSAATQAIGDASTCNLDVNCYAGWANTSNATAKAVFSESGYSYLCSGTLLSDLDTSTQVPYFLTANHCISTQTVASTLQTYWFYRSSSCNSGTLNPASTSVGGGATLLYHSNLSDATFTDTSFMQLNAAPPAGASYSGWSVTVPSLGTSLTAVHHPMGDLQKISFGSADAYQICTVAAGGKFYCSPSNASNGTFLEVPFTGGMTEGGSSGSGIFLPGGYLVGQLYGGGGGCGSDVGYYGRFDRAYTSALHQWLNPSTTSFGLSVALSGTGSGNVTSVPAGISCGAACNSNFASGTTVVLAATATGNSAFVGWSGACSGTGACNVTMDSAKNVTAMFNTVTLNTLSVTKSGSGLGTVTSSPSGIDCGNTCTAGYITGTLVTLSALPTSGSDLTGWSACSGTGTCSVTMSAATTVNATFTARADDGFPPASGLASGWVAPAGSSAAWSITTGTRYAGGSGLRSGAIGNSQTSAIAYIANLTAGNVTFARKVSSELSFDYLEFRIDGVLQARWSGEVDWSIVSFPVTAGTHTLSWLYVKDGSASAGSDTAWIDSVTVPALAPLPAAPTIGTVSSGDGSVGVSFLAGSVGSGTLVNYTASCSYNGTSYISATGASSPVTVTGLSNGVSYTCRVRTTTSTGVGDWSALSIPVYPAADVCFPCNGVLPSGWVQAAGSNAAWTVATDSYYSGGNSLKSGTIGNNQKSDISYSGSFPAGFVTFARRVSSEAGYDKLIFYIDGVSQSSWSGEVPWSIVSFPLSAGTHTLLWRYVKDASTSAGSDAAWIDSVALPGIAVSAQPQDGLWAIDAENNGQSGRGFQVETRNGTMVFTYYGYRAGGHDHWYLASGSFANGGFSGGMTQYQGGAALGASYAPATANGSAGTVAISFTSSTVGCISLPGESAKSISKFTFSGSSSPSVVPSNGLWAIDAENNGQPGRGFQIEQNAGILVFTYYGYDATGQETWYLASGSMSGSTFTAALAEYGGGTVLGQTYAPATSTGSPGQLAITFTSSTTGTITLPGESAKAISKFIW